MERCVEILSLVLHTLSLSIPPYSSCRQAPSFLLWRVVSSGKAMANLIDLVLRMYPPYPSRLDEFNRCLSISFGLSFSCLATPTSKIVQEHSFSRSMANH